MYSLAHVLLMGRSSQGVFTWDGYTALNSDTGAHGGTTPKVSVRLYPNGAIQFKHHGEFTYPGKWLTTLQESFGNQVEVRATLDSGSSGIVRPWSGVWYSLNIDRLFDIEFNPPGAPSTASGNIKFEFAFAATPEVIQFTQYVDFTLTKAA